MGERRVGELDKAREREREGERDVRVGEVVRSRGNSKSSLLESTNQGK